VRPRRSFTDDFKAGAVRLVLNEGKTIPQVARDLDLTESALRTWVERRWARLTSSIATLGCASRRRVAATRSNPSI
jgi:transposase